jgi:hypothetical protein
MVSMGCVDSAMVRAASGGERATLRREIGEATATGHLTGQAADIARAVVDRELLQGTPDAYGLAREHDVRGCVPEVDDELAARMKGDDAAAGEAALERAFAGALSESAARGYASRKGDRWRAVAMWGMTRDRDGEARRQGLVDGSPLVRRAALHAIVVHDDRADFGAVLEAARVDPDPLLRSLAVRALAQLAAPPTDIANRLRDLWTTGDDALRGDVAAAFASRGIFGLGGREALTHLLATASGNDAVSLAGVILGANVDDPSLRAAAASQLAIALSRGNSRAEIHAIAVVPLGHSGMPAADAKPLLDALRRASHADDAEVRLAALGRLATAGGVPEGDRRAAVAALERLAAPTAPAPRNTRARWLLAEAGDDRVQSWIEADLRSPDADVRSSAADALAALGRAGRAAPLLADEDPSVRTRAACTILAAGRGRAR